MSDIELLAQKLDSYIKANDKYHEERDEEYKLMAQKIDDMHAILTATGMFGKAFRWVLGTIIAISGAFIALEQLFDSSN